MTNYTELLYVNGINGETGGKLLDPIVADKLEIAIRQGYSAQERSSDRKISERSFEELKPDNPMEAGWCLLVAKDDVSKYQDLLGALITHRQGKLIVYNGESPDKWTERNYVGSNKFPRYVLIAGSPEKVSFDLQFSLVANNRFVGRLDFDEAQDYTNYAKNVIASESGKVNRPSKRAIFFAPKHSADKFEPQGCDFLAKPLFQALKNDNPVGIQYDPLLGDDATKANLLANMGVNQSTPPALLFTVGHGLAFPSGNKNQRLLQGSLVCQDFQSNPTHSSRPGCITGFDVDEGFQLPGGVHFMFACYGMGTRMKSDFVRYMPDDTKEAFRSFQSTSDFTAQLPMKLLARGNALAVIGHIDPAWNIGFRSYLTGADRINPYGLALERLVKGMPVGFAMQDFAIRYGLVSTTLLNIIEDDKAVSASDLASLWITRNDARNYMILGDPAVRIQFREN